MDKSIKFGFQLGIVQWKNSLRASRSSVTKYFLRNGIYQVLRDLTLLHNDEMKWAISHRLVEE